MKVSQNRDNYLLFLSILLCMLTVTACQRSGMIESGDQDEQRILSSFLLESDLPEGWFRSYFDTEVREGDTTYGTDFRASETVSQEPYLDYVVVTQEIIFYANETQAREAYPKQAKFAVWEQTPPEISFQSQADEFEVGCLYGTMAQQPENFCEAVARYDRLISILYVKTWDEDDEEQWFTWADFERALEAMDRRALEAAGR